MTIRAAGATDVGVQRVVNEDRYLVDADRGIFVVVDGVGGQAAGGRAADTALDVVRAKLTTGNGAVMSGAPWSARCRVPQRIVEPTVCPPAARLTRSYSRRSIGIGRDWK